MNIIRDSFFLTFSKGIRSIVMMVFVMVMARITSLQVYGTYRQLIMLSTMALAVAPLGIPISVSYYYKNLDIKKRNKLVSNTMIICFAFGIICSILFITFKNQISSSLNVEQINDYLLSFSLYLFILVASSFIENLYVSAECSSLFAIFNTIYYAVFLAILVGTIYKSNGLHSIILTMAILEAVRFILMLAWILEKINFKIDFDINFAKEQFVYCTSLGLVGIMQYFNTHLDKLLVSTYFNPSDFAIYSTGTAEIPIINLVTISLATAALPEMSKEYNTNKSIKNVLKIWGKITMLGAAIIFPVFFIAGFFNKGYIGFLYSEKYFSCIPLFLVRLLRLPLSCTVFGNILIVLGKQKVTIYNMIISIAINILFNIILIPPLGMMGATISGVIMHITSIFLQIYQIGKYTKVKIRFLLPYLNLFKVLCISFMVVFPVYLVASVINMHYIIEFFIFGALSFLLSFFVLAKVKLINVNLSEKFGFLKIRKKFEIT